MTSLDLERGADGVAVLRINRPAKRNALDDALLEHDLPAAVAAVAADDSVAVLVVTGAGGAFCAGADLESRAMDLASPAESEAFLRRSHRTPIGLRELGKPSIAAIDGPAVGAGLGIALACDLRVASPTARFATPFIRMGLPPDFGTSYFLPRAVGTAVALDMFLTARTLDADEALRVGLISRIDADPLACALGIAAELAANPPLATAATRRNVYQALELDLRAAILDNEVHAVAVALHGEEFRDALASWKRQILGRGAGVSGGPGA